MKSMELRKRFFKFFGDRGHQHVPSSSLIPAQDTTLLFTNAGMNQFKDVFLGRERRNYKTAVSIQKCVRAGGKHNDLDMVGFTKRHLTFFEMMGNFSFNDYFKKEAIEYAWQFLTQETQLPADKLHATVFITDTESYDFWKAIVPEHRIHRLGEKDNFWQMGEVGPCGPCTEIYIDRGPEFGCADCTPGCDCDRYLEIWNLVFMQYDRQVNGNLIPLKQVGVDTGMGLERLTAVVQHTDSVFQTDLFEPIIRAIETLTHRTYATEPAPLQAAFHVLADHIRSTTLLIADGCAPSNEGRGYVLRKIIRRAALFTQKLTDANIFPELSRTVVEQMGSIYPELIVQQDTIYTVLHHEIEKFSSNLVRGQVILNNYLAESRDTKIVSGHHAFKLYDTYGFPRELIILLAREQGYTVDLVGFDQEMEKQREQSGKKHIDTLDMIPLDDAIKTEFTGYQELTTTSAIIGLVHNEKSVHEVPEGEPCWIITRKSPFFIVGGGQVPDQGYVTIDDFTIPVQSVRYIARRIALLITAPCYLHIGTTVTAVVDQAWRANAMKNHTATHLLQAALIEVLGSQVKQSGSLVHPDYLRFDFTYHAPLSSKDIVRVEDLVNEKIRENIPVKIEYTDLKTALARGALAFFGEKYDPEHVRLVEVPDFSVELCGGTHVAATGDIGVFKITESQALAAGHRRIVALTGHKALALFQECFTIIKSLSQEFKVKKEDVLQTILLRNKDSLAREQEIKKIKTAAWHASIDEWLRNAEHIDSLYFWYNHLTDFDSAALREIVNTMAQRQEGIYSAVSTHNGRTVYAIALSPNLTQRFSLPVLQKKLQEKYQFKGGGSPTLLQGSGPHLTQDFMGDIKAWIQQCM